MNIVWGKPPPSRVSDGFSPDLFLPPERLLLSDSSPIRTVCSDGENPPRGIGATHLPVVRGRVTTPLRCVPLLGGAGLGPTARRFGLRPPVRSCRAPLFISPVSWSLLPPARHLPQSCHLPQRLFPRWGRKTLVEVARLAEVGQLKISTKWQTRWRSWMFSRW